MAGIKFGESLHQKWLAKKVCRMPTAALRRLLLLICNHYVYSSREGSRVAPLGIIPKGVSRSKFWPASCFQEQNGMIHHSHHHQLHL